VAVGLQKDHRIAVAVEVVVADVRGILREPELGGHRRDFRMEQELHRMDRLRVASVPVVPRHTDWGMPRVVP